MPDTNCTPPGGAAEAMSGYKSTVTLTLHLTGRHRSRESAEAFARELAASGQTTPGDWTLSVTTEPLGPRPSGQGDTTS
ncbi:MAG TPA: hypothetical protein VGM53_35505 [Streptosporangiaceae bacterium]|jgi:hypothetical protein